MNRIPIPPSANGQSLQYIMQNWQQIVKKYQTPNPKLAVSQMITSFLPFIGLWVLMYFSLEVSYFLTLGMAFLNAFFLVRIFIIQHDCGHQSFLSSRKLNNSIGFVCSLFSLIPYKYWAKSHNFHHGHNGQLEEEIRDIGDLGLLTVEEFSKLSALGKFKYRVYRMPIVLFGVGSMYYILIHNRLPMIKEKGFELAKRSLIMSNLAVILFYTALILIFGAKTFFKIQVPIIVFFGIIAIWFFYVQHQHEHAYKHGQTQRRLAPHRYWHGAHFRLGSPIQLGLWQRRGRWARQRVAWQPHAHAHFCQHGALPRV